jgi:hypothetical protein
MKATDHFGDLKVEGREEDRARWMKESTIQ